MSDGMTAAVEASIEMTAQADARDAIKHGATAPWGDGEVAQDWSDVVSRAGGLDGCEPRAAKALYVATFRSVIDAEAPRG